ncbi:MULTISPECIES: TetR/AcrR family transcriptional regulator [Bradyrhizobium]|uniref:TetR/AcrR family transcriptional regulator n=1 Tax=Bradyrhizobium TaxID=374 RepID=UPI000400C666|nr:MULTISPECIES: TetR/AcrR family transcriptional regulator [Bradyrhizobium]QOG17064.1 TetR family transcriptional regulator [Bradyrhizobium sp. SEMIA]UFW47911.1 TetR/AcrR family transcriptional regulator [Bradyrhizobium arachidis]
MPAVPKHRQPIINAAVTLFRRQGFARTGLNDIVDVSGAPKGSLYHYFPDGKSSIAVAAVEEAGRRVADTVAKLAAECGSTGELLRAHARLLAGWMQSSGFRNGCPITTVLLELAPRERAVSEAGRKAYAARLSILREKLSADGFARPRAEALAVLCTSALQGALIQARVERSGRPIETTAAELARLIEAEAERG